VHPWIKLRYLSSKALFACFVLINATLLDKEENVVGKDNKLTACEFTFHCLTAENYLVLYITIWESNLQSFVIILLTYAYFLFFVPPVKRLKLSKLI